MLSRLEWRCGSVMMLKAQGFFFITQCNLFLKDSLISASFDLRRANHIIAL